MMTESERQSVMIIASTIATSVAAGKPMGIVAKPADDANVDDLYRSIADLFEDPMVTRVGWVRLDAAD